MSKKLKENIFLVIGSIIFVSLMILQTALSRPRGGNSGLNVTTINGLICQFHVLVTSFMVVAVGKKGYVASIVLNIMSALSTLIMGVIVAKSMRAMPGVIVPIITIMAVTITYVYSLRIEKSKAELEKNNKELMETNKLIREKDETLTYLAYYDVLTGLANRQLFIERVDESIQENAKTPFTIIYFDIDDFKQINDAYGHNTGDMMLSTYADRLRIFCGDSDFVAKLGGDEFAVILKGSVTENGVASYIERLRNVVCKPVQIEGITLQTSMSFGVASYPESGSNSQELLRNTDIAIYNAKANGKNRICFYSQQQFVR